MTPPALPQTPVGSIYGGGSIMGGGPREGYTWTLDPGTKGYPRTPMQHFDVIFGMFMKRQCFWPHLQLAKLPLVL